VYFREMQHSYRDSLDISSPEQTVTLGRLTFSPEIGYRLRVRGGIVEPFIGLKGVWDFEKDKTSTIGGLVVGSILWRYKGLVTKDAPNVDIETYSFLTTTPSRGPAVPAGQTTNLSLPVCFSEWLGPCLGAAQTKRSARCGKKGRPIQGASFDHETPVGEHLC
jgi:hypothetical protein